MLLGTKGAALFPEQSQGMKWEQGKGEERGKTDDGNTKVKERERKEQGGSAMKAPSLRFRRLNVSCLV